MPCNSSGLVRPELLSNFSVVSVDWSNSKNVWVAQHPMDSEGALVAQAVALHAARPEQRVWVYRNLVIAYPWFPSVRAKMVDPAYAGWFLRFGAPPFGNGSYHVPRCDDSFSPPLCSDFYHSQDQTPGFPTGDGNCPGPCDCGGVPCGFYLFNHANDTLRRWLIDDFVFGPTGLGQPSGAISGLYLDDVRFFFPAPARESARTHAHTHTRPLRTPKQHWADAYDSTDGTFWRRLPPKTPARALNGAPQTRTLTPNPLQPRTAPRTRLAGRPRSTDTAGWTLGSRRRTPPPTPRAGAP